MLHWISATTRQRIKCTYPSCHLFSLLVKLEHLRWEFSKDNCIILYVSLMAQACVPHLRVWRIWFSLRFNKVVEISLYILFKHWKCLQNEYVTSHRNSWIVPFRTLTDLYQCFTIDYRWNTFVFFVNFIFIHPGMF